MAASSILYQQPNAQWAKIATDLVAGVHTLVTNLAPGSTGLFADGTVAAPGIAFSSEPGLGLYRVGAGEMAVAALGANVVDFKGVASAVNYVRIDNTITGFGPRVQAAGSDTNIPLVLAPKGTGALQAQQTDSTTVGGNARGAGAVDWQTMRAASTQVASGQGTFIGGGVNNLASGNYSAIGGGDTNTATALRAAVSGGQNNTVSTDYSWTPGGLYGTSRANYGRGAWSSGRFATQGDAQAGEFLLRRSTTDATVTRLTADGAAQGAANTVNLPNNGGYSGRIMVRCYQTTGTTIGDGATFDLFVQFTRITNAAGTTFDGGYYVAPTTLINTAIVAGTGFAPCIAKGGGTAWRLTVDADTTNGGMAISITGEASKTIRTVVRLMDVEVTA